MSLTHEPLRLEVRGRWRDTYHHADGRVVEGEWSDNQIQNNAAKLVAGLLRRAGETLTWPAFVGISYLAVGAGNASWDVTPPTQNRADAALTAESFRKAVTLVDLGFVDPADPPGSSPVLVYTRKFQVVVLLAASEANGSLREFALYGGEADGTVDSGLIMNWVVHPLIVKDATLTITRIIEIEIQLPV